VKVVLVESTALEVLPVGLKKLPLGWRRGVMESLTEFQRAWSNMLLKEDA
jgi:hypothetical protein